MSFFKDGKDYDQHLLKGHTKSVEHRAKLRAANLGNKHSEETLAKLRAASTGKKHSEETKAKMRASALNRIRRTSGNRYLLKCHTPDGIFDSMELAAKHYDKHVNTILYRIYGRNGKKIDKWRDWYIVE